MHSCTRTNTYIIKIRLYVSLVCTHDVLYRTVCVDGGRTVCVVGERTVCVELERTVCVLRKKIKMEKLNPNEKKWLGFVMKKEKSKKEKRSPLLFPPHSTSGPTKQIVTQRVTSEIMCPTVSFCHYRHCNQW